MSLAGSMDEPLILADGTRIDPSSGKVLRDRSTQSAFVEIAAPSVAQEIVARTRRSIAELPLPSGQMNSVSLVLFYTLWGLSKQDTAIATGLSIEQVKNIQKLDQYKTLAEDLQKNILEQQAGDLRTFFQQKAAGAAQKIVDIVEEDDGVLGFKAAQDILDRAGMRPADVVMHKHQMENTLRIEFVRKDIPEDLPAIEADYKDITPNADRT